MFAEQPKSKQHREPSPVLLSDECVSYEIQEHVFAYEWSVGKRYYPNLIAAAFSLQNDYDALSVYRAVVSIDVRESNVSRGNLQVIAFDYRSGICDVYIGTWRDPWASFRWGIVFFP